MCPCQVCTEARDATQNAKKRVQKPKLGPAKRARKRVRGAFQGRRTSRFAGIYIYIYVYFLCLLIEMPSMDFCILVGDSEVLGIQSCWMPWQRIHILAFGPLRNSGENG